MDQETIDRLADLLEKNAALMQRMTDFSFGLSKKQCEILNGMADWNTEEMNKLKPQVKNIDNEN